MNTFTSTSTNVNLKANKVRTSLLLCIDAEWTKQQKKPQMLINSRSPIIITKSYDSFEINITNPREYGGVVSSIHKSNMIQMLKSPDWSECNSDISRVNSAIDEEFQLKKHLLSQNKLININATNNSNNNVHHSKSNKKDFEQKKTMNDVMKHGFMELRKIAKELKVRGRSGNANKKKSPDKRDSKKKISLFRKHQSANDTTTNTVQQCKQKYKIRSDKNLITFNDKEQNENKFTETKSKTALIVNNSVDDSTDSNDNNFIIKRSQNAESNLLALQYRPNGVSQCQSPSPRQKSSKVTIKSPLHNAKNDNKRISFGMDNQIITLKGCSTFS